MDRMERSNYRFALARELNESFLFASGASGDFIGNINDNCVFERYVREGTWSPGLIEFLNIKFAAGNGTYIDIGANIGLTVIPIAKRCGVRCIAVEAEPNNFRLLKSNLALNDVDHLVSAHNFAAYSKHTILSFELSAHNFGDHHISLHEATAGDLNRTIKVEARRLDDLTNSLTLQHPIICKIDTQGAEPDVLKGGQNLIRQTETLIIEADPKLLARQNYSLDDLLSPLEAAGFSHGFIAMFDQDYPTATSDRSDIKDLLESAKSQLFEGSIPYLDLVLSR
jgi:FkbM family methyltransferase